MPTAAMAACQPNEAMIQAPTSGTATVPRLPPAMWTAIAEACARACRCSAISPLPTGCWGDPAILAPMVAREKPPHEVASPVAVIAAP